ncbi:MAG: hypothetical protein EOP62_20455 [Sphingomonadales bacterium]|nr:MAG: hypothetical protein EOP62_20455 [Sphingomonadales bacterium]
MRLKLFVAILALLPMPALADVTARYSTGKDVLLVEIDDNGNARVGIDGQFGLIRRDGTDYAVMIGADGETRVVELAELIELMGGANKASAGTANPAIERANFLLIAKGEATVAGRVGVIWSFGPEKENDGRPGEMLEVVMSADPTLAPIGTLLRRMMGTLQPFVAMIVPEASGFYPKAVELAAKGAPLRVAKIELQSIDTADIAAARFDLPAPVISAAEFAATMGSGPNMEVQPLP